MYQHNKITKMFCKNLISQYNNERKYNNGIKYDCDKRSQNPKIQTFGWQK